MKTNFLIFIIIFMIPSIGISQPKVGVSDYLDYELINKYVDSLNKKSVSKIILLQTDNKTVHNLKIISKDDRLSFLIWQKDGATNLLLISGDSIYYANNAMLSNIFTYSNIEKCWLDSKENIYQLVPPITTPDKKEILIGFGEYKDFFFEIGANSYYKNDKKRDKKRKEWLNIIYSYIKSIKYVSLQHYTRGI